MPSASRAGLLLIQNTWVCNFGSKHNKLIKIIVMGFYTKLNFLRLPCQRRHTVQLAVFLITAIIRTRSASKHRARNRYFKRTLE